MEFVTCCPNRCFFNQNAPVVAYDILAERGPPTYNNIVHYPEISPEAGCIYLSILPVSSRREVSDLLTLFKSVVT